MDAGVVGARLRLLTIGASSTNDPSHMMRIAVPLLGRKTSMKIELNHAQLQKQAVDGNNFLHLPCLFAFSEWVALHC
jgi:hypothetical protein